MTSPDGFDEREYKSRFPYTLSLEGHVVPGSVPANEFPMEAGDSEASLVQLGRYDYANLDEAIAVGHEYPGHEVFRGFTRHLALEIRFQRVVRTAGLTVVRLMITPPQLEIVRAHENIKPDKIYPVQEHELWAYDFKRAKKVPLILFYDSKVQPNFPPLDRVMFKKIIRETYFDDDGELTPQARQRLKHDPEKMAAYLDDEVPLPGATNQEVRCARILAEDVARITAPPGASEEEVQKIKAGVMRRLFDQD